jgi:hypothetical protein
LLRAGRTRAGVDDEVDDEEEDESKSNPGASALVPVLATGGASTGALGARVGERR